MNRRHEVVQRSALGPLILSSVLFAPVLIMSEPLARAATSAVTIGGPFTLSTPDGTTVTDQTYRGKWLLVYFGYTFCPNSCPTTLLEVATALKKLGLRCRPSATALHHGRSAARHAEGDAAIHSVVRSADRRPHRHSAANRCGRPRIWGLLCAVTGLDPAPMTTSWTTVLTFTSWILGGKFVRAFDTDTSGDRIADALRELMAQGSR